MGCEKLLKLASQGKLNKEEIQENCFLGFEHFLRFAYSASKRIIEVKDYLVFLINKTIKALKTKVQRKC